MPSSRAIFILLQAIAAQSICHQIKFDLWWPAFGESGFQRWWCNAAVPHGAVQIAGCTEALWEPKPGDLIVPAIAQLPRRRG
jgi:hypothetical protein